MQEGICRCTITILSAIAIIAGSQPAHSSDTDWRELEFSYSVMIEDIPANADTASAWLPVPLNSEYQQLLSSIVAGDYPYALVEEPKYGNRFLRFYLAAAAGGDATLEVTFHVMRRGYSVARKDHAPVNEAATLDLYLTPSSMVPDSGPFVVEALTIVGEETDPFRQGRQLFDHIVDTMAYDKSGEGWGRGDAAYACDIRKGNCTDFHSLFIGQARSLGIPARFTMGFPVPGDMTEGEIGGYHCWAEYYTPDYGWVPLDASEANKHPEMREALYGALPADRIAFTRGRDYVLPGSADGPRNFVIYPYVEVDGQEHAGCTKSFSFVEH